MTDNDVIEEAYRAALKDIFRVFFGSYTNAQGDPEGESDAERAFRKGVQHARHVRDRALAVLP